MFNSNYKKQALENLENEGKRYEKFFMQTVKKAEDLHKVKVFSVGLIGRVENFVNSITNSPKEYSKKISSANLNKVKFDQEHNRLEAESLRVNKVSGGAAGAGVIAGAGVAAFAPSAAMAIATTFGTASTGTAISALSGAAASNAALAWLGGGALVSGGGGMTAGNALLALAGPVGWAIGGSALVGSGLFASHKNKKIAEDAERELGNILEAKEELLILDKKVDTQKQSIDKLKNGVSSLLIRSKAFKKSDFNLFTEEEKYQLGELVNSVLALSELINEKVS